MQVKEEIMKILPKPANQLRVAHIITASKPEKDVAYMKQDQTDLMKTGFKVDKIDIEGKTENELRQTLKDKDIIYVQGGNTFYLMKAVRESGFETVVKDLINRGVIYIGVSAGSVIAGPTIEVAGWKNMDKNIVGLKNLTGMNLVPFLVFVHYQPSHLPLIKSELLKTPYPVRIFTDDQAILVRNKKIRLVGKGKEVKI